MNGTTLVTLGADRRTLDPFCGFQTPGDLLTAVKDAAIRPHAVDERLRPLAAAGSDEQGTYSDPAGGFLVPDSIAPFVANVQDGGEEDPAIGRTLPVPMSTPVVHVSARVDKTHTTSVSGGLRVYRRPETVDITTSRGEYERITLDAQEAIGLTFATNELVMDSFPSFAAVLGASYRDEFNATFLEERIRGTGVGEMQGILTSPALITVSKEGGQAADTIVGDNVIKMRARCWGYRRAVWIANHDAVSQICRLTITIGTAGAQIPAWRPGNEDGTPDSLLGRPLIYSESASTLGDVGDLMLVNWSQYLDGTYQPFQGISSLHVRYLAHETAFKFWVRNAGAGWWRSALTPRRSTTTLSPYVTLAART
jgi:HK97 family phage major capsid protein